MLHLINVDDYTLVVPGPEDESWVMADVQKGRELNQAYLASLAAAPQGGKITGSFIYAHPPDYIGRNTLDWDTTAWRALFREMKDLGIDTVIYQAAVWSEFKECYYPSRLFKDFRTWNCLDPLLEAVAREGMTLFLGGLGNLYALDDKATADTLARDGEEQLACYDELAERYAGGYQGFYMSPETGFPGKRQPEREALLNAYYRGVCTGVKARTPGMPILLSPGTWYHPDTEQENEAFLLALFKDCPIDILSPQDSVGTFGNRLPYLQASFEVWRRVCAQLGVSLWVNVESFERVKVGTDLDFIPAGFERLAVQLSSAAQVGKKIVSWETPYFYSALAGEQGLALRKAYLESLKAGNRD
jgi:hypothetical protein